jgi:hypothetical protein
MPQIVLHTMQHLFSIITHPRKAGGERLAIASLILLLPLSLGWPLAIWLTGGRGSAAASCLVLTIWRSISCAVHGSGPATGAKPALP